MLYKSKKYKCVCYFAASASLASIFINMGLFLYVILSADVIKLNKIIFGPGLYFLISFLHVGLFANTACRISGKKPSHYCYWIGYAVLVTTGVVLSNVLGPGLDSFDCVIRILQILLNTFAVISSLAYICVLHSDKILLLLKEFLHRFNK